MTNFPHIARHGHRPRRAVELRVMLPGATVHPSTRRALDEWQRDLACSRGEVVDLLRIFAEAHGFAGKRGARRK